MYFLKKVVSELMNNTGTETNIIDIKVLELCNDFPMIKKICADILFALKKSIEKWILADQRKKNQQIN